MGRVALRKYQNFQFANNQGTVFGLGSHSTVSNKTFDWTAVAAIIEHEFIAMKWPMEN